MAEIKLCDIKNRLEFRAWLEDNHKTAKDCWIALKRGHPKDNLKFWYLDAVEEALCFGWIDSTVKKLNQDITAQRFTPRRKSGKWSELNKERCRRLEKLGLMRDCGRAVLPDMSPESFIIDADIMKHLKADIQIWNNFIKFPPLYIRVRIDTIQIKKNNPDLFKSRLEKFLLNTKANIMYGDWNDSGRLLDY